MLESTPPVESFVKISVPMSFKLRKLKHFCGFVIALNLFSSKSVCTPLPFSAVQSIWFLIVKTFRRLESLAVQMHWTSLSAILFDIFVALQSSLIALYLTRSRVVFDRRGNDQTKALRQPTAHMHIWCIHAPSLQYSTKLVNWIDLTNSFQQGEELWL